VRTGQGEDFVSNVDCCIMLAFVQCLLPPTSQVFVHVALNARDSSDFPSFWSPVQYPKRVICLSSDHVEYTSSRSSKRLIAAIANMQQCPRTKKSRLQRQERATVLVF
jgi:hypothetical protein